MSDFTDADRATLHSIRDGQLELYRLATEAKTPPAPLEGFANGFRYAGDPNGFVQSETAERYRLAHPTFDLCKLLCIRDVLAIPGVEERIPHAMPSGENLVKYLCDNAGWQIVAKDWTGNAYPDVMACFGGRYDIPHPDTGVPIYGWETKVAEAIQRWERAEARRGEPTDGVDFGQSPGS